MRRVTVHPHDPFATRRVYTVGHSNREIEDLLAVLRTTGIRTLVDVRRYPASRRHPHFNRSELSASLLQHGVIYHHLGKSLGGMMEQSYESYMRSPPFRRGLEVLEDLAGSSVTAIMCAEREPAECHRRHLADCLADRGWEVVHLLGADESRPHHPTEQRRLF